MSSSELSTPPSGVPAAVQGRVTVDVLAAAKQLLALPCFALVVMADPSHLAAALAAMDVVARSHTSGDVLAPEAAEYLAALLQVHLQVPTFHPRDLVLGVGELPPGLRADELDFLVRVASVARSPRDVNRLVNRVRCRELAVGLAHRAPTVLVTERPWRFASCRQSPSAFVERQGAHGLATVAWTN